MKYFKAKIKKDIDFQRGNKEELLTGFENFF